MRVLTCMFTIQRLYEAEILTSWKLSGAGLPIRNFYYTGPWLKEFNALPNGYAPKGGGSLIPVRARLAALIDRYVDGTPTARLLRPFGEGSHPIWQRMRDDQSAVVEFRTWDTRTFGFFKCPDVFVASCVGLTDRVKADQEYTARGNSVLRFMSRVLPSEIDGVTDVRFLVTDRNGCA
jgi:hypothetical protein